ncbi:MAG: S-layer homology domain-containing protein [Clostridia bacterium]|nr:S-layer homology domain-containing protein [Clostridia bacterium]
MKIWIRMTVCVLLTALLIGPLPTGAVSPGLSNLAISADMAKAGLQNGEIRFSADDFARALNRARLREITVTVLPPAEEGTLKLGTAAVYAGQVISQNALDLLHFVPAAAAVTESAFRFTAEGASYPITCSLYLLPRINYAPTVELADDGALAVSTHRAISCFGTLPAYDPEGDPLTYEIVRAPKKGTVTFTDRSTGDYCYTPAAGKTGRDSFRYVVRDKYGNYSAAATVSVTITRPKTAVVFADMENHWAHNAALTMIETGLMQGRQIGNTVCFAPNEPVSRGEFLVMAMQAAGMGDVPQAVSTGFADDAAIPVGMKGYVAAAAELGYVRGREVEGVCKFCPDDTVTRAEAAVILNNILKPEVPTVRAVFADADGVPAWAYDALSALNTLGVMSGTGGGVISANSPITRAQAAQIFCAVMALE